MAELKTKKNDASVDEFLASIPDEQQRADSIAVCKLMHEATGEEPKMWGDSIVGFGSYHYKYSSGREADWMLTGFAPRKGSITLYIMSGFEDYAEATGYDPQPLLDKLGSHSTGKACLYIKKLSDIDPDILRQLIAGSVNQMRAIGQ